MLKNTTPTIAIVDDHPLLRKSICAFLHTNGYSVIIEAGNGKELIHHLQITERLPDICLLDLNMPEMDGYATTRHLRLHYPTIRILACAQFARQAQIEKIFSCGADGFLPKEEGAERWKFELDTVAGTSR